MPRLLPWRRTPVAIRLPVALALVAVSLAALPTGHASAAPNRLPLCGAHGSPPAAPRHVLLVVLENQSFPSVVGTSSAMPYQRSVLGSSCGLATRMYGATHTSAANYLALVAGQYPKGSPRACGSVRACSTGVPSLFSQLEGRQGWRSYVESMPRACDPVSSGAYKIGHNPALFLRGIDCRGRDLGVPDLTARSGPLWADLSARTLPGLSVVVPDLLHDGEHGPARADAWLRAFLGTVLATPSYQSGDTAVLVTYDEGNGPDGHPGQDCTDRAADLAGRQPSCHVATFVVWPWAHGTDDTFFTHYSVTRTVADLFGLAPLAGAGGASTLLGHLGLPRP